MLTLQCLKHTFQRESWWISDVQQHLLWDTGCSFSWSMFRVNVMLDPERLPGVWTVATGEGLGDNKNYVNGCLLSSHGYCSRLCYDVNLSYLSAVMWGSKLWWIGWRWRWTLRPRTSSFGAVLHGGTSCPQSRQRGPRTQIIRQIWNTHRPGKILLRS